MSYDFERLKDLTKKNYDLKNLKKKKKFHRHRAGGLLFFTFVYCVVFVGILLLFFSFFLCDLEASGIV